MGYALLMPPVVFIIYLALSMGLSAVSKRLASKGVESAGKEKAYACGEDMEENQGQPEYSQFYKFAFFFTIMHVVVLVVATDPAGISPMSAVYLGVTVLSMYMLIRK
jgi:NADH:ubiquinone oxidoreductase subunit 3 (subunit A)